MRANFFIVSFSIVILVFVSSYDVNFLDYGAPISYANWNKINWRDFRGKRRPGYHVDGERKIAFVYSDFEMYREDGDIYVPTYFHPSRSYVFNNRTTDRNLFTHEIYHLHITEWCARLLRKHIYEQRGLSDDTLQMSFETYQHFADSIQMQYDSETHHGFRLGRQRVWEQTVDSALFHLKDFSNFVVPLN